MPTGLIDLIRQLFRTHGALTAPVLAREAKTSQPTIARALKLLGDEVIAVGRGRARKYALARKVREIPSRCPIYLIDEKGQAHKAGVLIPTEPRGFTVVSESVNLRTRIYDDWPYWLDDMRPSGFLGRLIPRRYPELGYPDDIRMWSSSDCFDYLYRLGWDAIGNVILGERAFAGFIANSKNSPFLATFDSRAESYERFATEVLNNGVAGSSAGGEQPKFLASRSNPDNSRTAVIVKFVPMGMDPVSSRWRDLLTCEHLVHQALRALGNTACNTTLITGSTRLFLEIERFDRTKVGRHGVISIGTLSAEFEGSVGSWRELGAKLLAQRIITTSHYSSILQRFYLGVCIANTDMHPGNLSFFCDGEKLLEVTPSYDMLPMGLAPIGSELRPVSFTPPSLPPDERMNWEPAARVAIKFWQQVQNERNISPEIVRYAAAFEEYLETMVA